MSKASPYLNRSETINRHHNHLPHWQQKHTLQFITWHLGDALSVQARNRIRLERSIWLRKHPKPWDALTEKEYYTKFDGRIQKWLDQGIGHCWMRNPNLAEVVVSCLHHLNGIRLHLDAYVVMPNHVHMLCELTKENEMDKVMKSLKGYSAYKINRMLQRSGTFWMEDYWDRMIRDSSHYLRVRNYIRNNPVKANLAEGEYRLWVGEEKTHF